MTLLQNDPTYPPYGAKTLIYSCGPVKGGDKVMLTEYDETRVMAP